MRVLFLLFVAVCGAGCYPKFNLREPVYIVPGPSYRWPCEVWERAEACRRTILEGAEMWFLHLPEKDRPKIIVTYTPPAKSVNEVIYVEVDPNINHPAHLLVRPRPLRIVIRLIIIGPIGIFVIGHEFGHAILGPQHEGGWSIMTKEAGTPFKPTSADLARLCKKHPELRCPKK